MFEGDSGVGKTAFLQRYFDDYWSAGYVPTCAMDDGIKEKWLTTQGGQREKIEVTAHTCISFFASFNSSFFSLALHLPF
jgi:GTPase SAR1 family protein